jgi:hypothetical protein
MAFAFPGWRFALVDRPASRRAVWAGAAAAALAALDGGRPPVAAKRKRKRCRFDKTPTTWTLRKSCTAKKSIRLPDGVTLDGAGFTIKARGLAENFGSGVIESIGSSAGVRNLTLDASGVTNGCNSNSPQHGIFFGLADGAVEASTVRGVCGWAIETGSDGVGKTLDITDCTIDATGSVRGGAVVRAGAVVRTTISNAKTAILVTDGDATIDACTVTGAETGLRASSANVIVSNNRFTVDQYGMVFEFSGSADVTSNTIVGANGIPGETVGILFRDSAGGRANVNTVSGFVNTAGPDGCGIMIAADAGAVTLDGNAFPPPANEQDICDDRS